MFVIWNHLDDMPYRFNGIVLYPTSNDALSALIKNADHIGADLSGDWYSIENVHRDLGKGLTIGTMLRNYYTGE